MNLASGRTGRHGGGEMARQRGHNEGTSLREDAGYDEKC
jgi:hypothetical protein